MTWNYGSQGQFFVKWAIQTNRHPNKHLFICWRYKNEPFWHTFIYQKALVAVKIYKNYSFFIKISSFVIVNIKLFTIFQFRAKDTSILALVANVSLEKIIESQYSILITVLSFTYIIIISKIGTFSRCLALWSLYFYKYIFFSVKDFYKGTLCSCNNAFCSDY